jgi:hypothetical protein
MTLALYDGEFRVLNSQGCLDVDATVNVLRCAAEVLAEAVAAKPN